MSFASKPLAGYLAKAFLRKSFCSNYIVGKQAPFKLLAGL